MSPYDLRRLESYANNMLDYHVILDLLPTVASLYFEKRLGDQVRLSAVQCTILLALGLQRKTIEDVEVCIRPEQKICHFDHISLG
jgi:N-acetyltransferase 10